MAMRRDLRPREAIFHSSIDIIYRKFTSIRYSNNRLSTPQSAQLWLTMSWSCSPPGPVHCNQCYLGALLFAHLRDNQDDRELRLQEHRRFHTWKATFSALEASKNRSSANSNNSMNSLVPNRFPQFEFVGNHFTHFWNKRNYMIMNIDIVAQNPLFRPWGPLEQAIYMLSTSYCLSWNVSTFPRVLT